MDFDEEIECRQNQLHEVIMLNCNMMTRSLHCVLLEVINMPICVGLNEVDILLEAFEREVPEKQRFKALDYAPHTKPSRWWGYTQGKL